MRSPSSRRASLSAALWTAACGALAAPRPAAAQAAVACVNCSTAAQQLLEYARQAEQLRQQIQAYALQGRQYLNMVQNTVGLPMMAWQGLRADVAMVQGILRQGEHLVLDSGFSIGQLGSYASYVSALTDAPTKYRMWSQQANSNVTALMRAFGTQQDQLPADQANLEWARNQVASADGQVRVAQAHAAVSAAGVGELQKLRQAFLGQSQMAANIAQLEEDRRALAAAQLVQMQDAPLAPVDGGARY